MTAKLLSLLEQLFLKKKCNMFLSTALPFFAFAS